MRSDEDTTCILLSSGCMLPLPAHSPHYDKMPTAVHIPHPHTNHSDSEEDPLPINQRMFLSIVLIRQTKPIILARRDVTNSKQQPQCPLHCYVEKCIPCNPHSAGCFILIAC